MSALAAKFGTVATRVRSQGLAATARKFWRDHIFCVTNSVLVEYREGWRPAKAKATMPANTEFVVAEQADALPPLCDWLAWREPAFRRMLDEGKTGLLILLDGVAVGCAWISFTDHVDRKAHEHYRVLPGEAYHYCWLVDPGCRNSQIALALCRRTMQFLADRGIRRQFGIVDLTNTASYLIQIYFGYRECGTKITHYYVLGTQWTRVSSYTGLLGPQRRTRQQIAHAT